MGFVLFDQSTVFNPLDYGLSVGDNLAVIVVGGGGGGGAGAPRAYYNETNYYRGHLPGGTGGSSSFGEYVTALGGAGGAGWGVYRSSWSTTQPNFVPVANATQGRYQARTMSNNNSQCGTAGAAGWLPGFDWYAENSDVDLKMYITGDAERTCLKFVQRPGLSGYPAMQPTQAWHVQQSNYQRIYTEYPNDALYCPALAPVFNITYYSNYPYIGAKVHQRLLSISGGNGNRPQNSSTNYTDAGVPAFGGLGYGAGGGGASNMSTSSYNYVYTPYGGNGGNSGEVKYANVSLTSLEPIAVTVGGGGGGAGWACYNSVSGYKNYSYEGKAGGAGTAGAACSTNHENSGGYGSTPGGHGLSAANDAYTSYQQYQSNYGRYVGAGGGAGGCVAIWW